MAIDFWRFKRLGKARQQHILEQLQKAIDEYNNTYTPMQIKQWWRKDSLSYSMGIDGHCIEKPWDTHDIYYRAGQIVEFCNQVFNDHTTHKLEIYQIMEQMGRPFDKLMFIDYNRAKKRAEKYGTYDKCVNSYEIDNNLEGKIKDDIRLFCFNHRKEVLCGLGVATVLAVVGIGLCTRKED